MSSSLALAIGLLLQPAPEPCYDLLVVGRLRSVANVVPFFDQPPAKSDERAAGATGDVLIEVDRVIEGKAPPRQFWARDIFTSQRSPRERVVFYLAADSSGAYGVIDDRAARRDWLGRTRLPADGPPRCPSR